MATLKLRKLPGKSIETQILNTYREGFFNYLIGTGTFYKIRDQYLELFDKCFNTKNNATNTANVIISRLICSGIILS